MNKTTPCIHTSDIHECFYCAGSREAADDYRARITALRPTREVAETIRMAIAVTYGESSSKRGREALAWIDLITEGAA